MGDGERSSKRRRYDSDDDRKDSRRRSKHDRRERKSRRIDLAAEGIRELTTDDFEARTPDFSRWLDEERDQVRFVAVLEGADALALRRAVIV